MPIFGTEAPEPTGGTARPMRVAKWLRLTVPIMVGALVGLGVVLIQWERVPQCVYPARGCRVGFPHDCDFPPCPTHGSVHWLAVVTVAVVASVIATVITIGATARRDL